MPAGNLKGFALMAEVHQTEDVVMNMHDQDWIHVAKKLFNPSDSATRALTLGAYVATLDHVAQLRGLADQSTHGARLKDVLRKDRQNWPSVQRCCRRRVLRLLRTMNGAGMARSLGTYFYYRMLWRFIHIYYSTKTPLGTRIMYASYVIHFLARWRMWVKKHTGTGINLKTSYISREAHTDAMIACHNVINVILLFRDRHDNLPVCLRKLGSDCCEKLFSEHGSWVVNKRNYTAAAMAQQCAKMNMTHTIRVDPGGPEWGQAVHHKCVWGGEHGTDSDDGSSDSGPGAGGPGHGSDSDSDYSPSGSDSDSNYALSGSGSDTSVGEADGDALSSYRTTQNRDVQNAWEEGDKQAKADLEQLGMAPNECTHGAGGHPWWGLLSCKLLCKSRKVGNRSNRVDDLYSSGSCDENSDSSDSGSDGGGPGSPARGAERFLRVPLPGMPLRGIAQLLGVTASELKDKCRGYVGFKQTKQSSTLFGDVPIPAAGWAALKRLCILRLRNHKGHEIYEQPASRESDSGSDSDSDSDFADDEGGGGSGSDGCEGVEEEWLAEGDRWVAASIGGKVSAYVDVPGGGRQIHKATLVSHKNNDPTCPVDRLLRVKNATEPKEQEAASGVVAGVGDVIAYDGGGDRWAAGVVRSIVKERGRARTKYREPVSLDEPGVTLLVSPLVKQRVVVDGKQQVPIHAQHVADGELKMLLADCAEARVELRSVQRVMSGGRSTKPSMDGSATNAKEWTLSKGETTWFMKYPRRPFNSSIKSWQ